MSTPKVDRLKAADSAVSRTIAEYGAAIDDIGEDEAHAYIGVRAPQALEMFALRLRTILGDDVDDETGWHGGGWDDDES